jgi:hypothetical protein
VPSDIPDDVADFAPDKAADGIAITTNETDCYSLFTNISHSLTTVADAQFFWKM